MKCKCGVELSQFHFRPEYDHEYGYTGDYEFVDGHDPDDSTAIYWAFDSEDLGNVIEQAGWSTNGEDPQKWPVSCLHDVYHTMDRDEVSRLICFNGHHEIKAN